MRPASAHSPERHVLVLIEPGRAGAAALRRAQALVLSEPAELTLVALAPRASGPRCGTSIQDYNRTVLEAAHEDLARARAKLAAPAARVRCRVLVEGIDPPLDELVARGGFDHVVLPERWRFWRRRGEGPPPPRAPGLAPPDPVSPRSPGRRRGARSRARRRASGSGG